MFFVISGIFAGLVLGTLTFVFTSQNPKPLGWLVPGYGIFALLAILPVLISILVPLDFGINPVFSISLGEACLISGIGALVTRRSRQWSIWLGLALGSVPVLFWVIFITAEILFPHG